MSRSDASYNLTLGVSRKEIKRLQKEVDETGQLTVNVDVGGEQCPKYASIDDGLSRSEFSWLMKAVNLASMAEGRSMHGAVVVKGGSLLGVGINRSKTHNRWVTYQSREWCTVHAEMSAMRNADYVMGATVYVARVNRSGELRASAPCHLCRGFLDNFEVKKVVHT